MQHMHVEDAARFCDGLFDKADADHNKLIDVKEFDTVVHEVRRMGVKLDLDAGAAKRVAYSPELLKHKGLQVRTYHLP
eukprot:4476664-Pyramimonas_sp.AAC.1